MLHRRRGGGGVKLFRCYHGFSRPFYWKVVCKYHKHNIADRTMTVKGPSVAAILQKRSRNRFSGLTCPSLSFLCGRTLL